VFVFGEVVRAHRRRLGLSQEELAEKAGVNARTIGNIEARRILSPRPATVRLLATAFDLRGPDRDRFCAAAIPVPDPFEATAPGTLAPRQLPAVTRHFVGRDAELGQLDAVQHRLGAAAPVVAIVGTAGVGKTALAVQWGHRVRADFPDGQLYANMHGYSLGPAVAPVDVLGRFLRALGVASDKVPADIDEAAALYRSVVADRHLLIVLDNVCSADHVRPILPGGRCCVTIVTSRARLDGLVALDGATRIKLDVLTLPEALNLLVQLVGADAINAEAGAAASLAEACARLPLALRIAAAQLAGHGAPKVVEHLAALCRGDPLATLAVDDDPTASVASTLDHSFRNLSADAARLFRLLGLSPAPDLGVHGIGALAGLPEQRVGTLVNTLCDAHLVTEVRTGRFGMHDLVRLYAHRRARDEESDSSQRDAVARLLDWYTDAVVSANLHLVPTWQVRWERQFPPESPRTFASSADALAWYDQELAALGALTRLAVDTQPRVVWPLVQGQVPYLIRSHMVTTLMELSQLGFDHADRTGHKAARAAHANSLGIGCSLLSQPDEALGWYRRAITDYERIGDARLVSRMYLNIGAICSEVKRFDEAVSSLRAGLDIVRAIGDRVGEGAALGNLGFAYQKMGEFKLAEPTLLEAIQILHESGYRHAEFLAVGNLGAAYVAQGRFAEAAPYLEEGIRLGEEVGDRLNTARNHLALGDAHQSLGAGDDARREWSLAHAIFIDIDSIEAAEAQTRLGGAVFVAQAEVLRLAPTAGRSPSQTTTA
jgi:tetratricopeptide (TPR) repeat protein/transcriptional regulator with XRE-family HTH domain